MSVFVFIVFFVMVFGSVVADMGEAPLISTEKFPFKLDNFLANEWIEMTPLQSLSYYTKREVCDVTKGSSNCGSFNSEMDYCAISSTGFGHVNGYCENNVGAFLRHQDVKDWPESENELDVIRMMREQGSNTIVMIGDSVTGQHIRNTQCDLKRAGVQIKSVHETWKTVKLLQRGDSIPVNSFEILDPFGSKTKDKLPYFQFIFFHQEEFNQNFHYFSKMYHDLTENIQKLPVVKGKVMYIYNFGLHYTIETPAIDILANASTAVLIEASKQGHTVIFRETSAQHFNTPTGLFMHTESIPQISSEERTKDISPIKHNFNRMNTDLMNTQTGRDTVDFSKLDKSKLQHIRCKRIESEEALDKQNWRNKRVHKIINELDPTHENIGIDNFYRVSAARSDLHIHSSHDADCTHFCLSPVLWAPTWDYIAKFYRKKHNIKQFKDSV